MRQRVRVVLADDHDVFVEGLSMVLAAEEDLEVVAVANDGAAALQAVLAHQPDVLVADADLPGPDLAELVRLVARARPATRVLPLLEQGELVGAGVPARAAGSKGGSGRQLAAAIRALVDGRPVPPPGPRPPAAAGALARRSHVDLLLRTLSSREREVLGLLGRGWSNRRIAEECYLSLNTVRTHVQNVLTKLGVHSKLEAAALAVREGLVPAAPPRPRPRA
jgi:DNA-binding NarL/FixJ family response regulator